MHILAHASPALRSCLNLAHGPETLWDLSSLPLSPAGQCPGLSSMDISPPPQPCWWPLTVATAPLLPGTALGTASAAAQNVPARANHCCVCIQCSHEDEDQDEALAFTRHHGPS